MINSTNFKENERRVVPTIIERARSAHIKDFSQEELERVFLSDISSGNFHLRVFNSLVQNGLSLRDLFHFEP